MFCFSGDSLKMFEIAVGSTLSVEDHALCHYQEQPQEPGTTRGYTCKESILGRYVSIRLLHRGCLSLCEVEILQQNAHE